jgi:ATP-dependent helicase/nuclease subunit B
VTEIETWMRNPYAIYARHVLRLKPLDAIAADPGAAERGEAMHKALENFVRAYPDRLPADAERILLDMGEAAFADLLARQPEVWAFWTPRFRRVAAWFVAAEAERRPPARALATEVAGAATLAGSAGAFTLRATADRIDLLGNGKLCIIDYKTGMIPSETAVELGFAPQLPLEAAIAMKGGFSGVDARAVGEIAWWKLSGGATPGEIKTPKNLAAEELAAAAWLGLERLIAAFDKPETAYVCRPRPEWAPRYDDYAHLARVAEWSAADEEEGE